MEFRREASVTSIDGPLFTRNSEFEGRVSFDNELSQIACESASASGKANCETYAIRLFIFRFRLLLLQREFLFEIAELFQIVID